MNRVLTKFLVTTLKCRPNFAELFHCSQCHLSSSLSLSLFFTLFYFYLCNVPFSNELVMYHVVLLTFGWDFFIVFFCGLSFVLSFIKTFILLDRFFRLHRMILFHQLIFLIRVNIFFLTTEETTLFCLNYFIRA